MPTYTCQGMTKAVSSELDSFGNKVYTKGNLTSKQIDNFLKRKVFVRRKHYSRDHIYCQHLEFCQTKSDSIYPMTILTILQIS